MPDKNKLHILVMSASWQSALACIQSFGRAGHGISIIPTKGYSPNYSSVFVKSMLKIDATSSEELPAELLRLVRQQGIDLVIPVSDQDAELVASAKQLGSVSDAFIVSPLETISLTRSRNKTIELCRRLGIDTPKTEFVTHENATAAARDLGYPCFLKLSGSVAGQGVFKILGEEELAKKLETIPRHSEMQIQERIDGDLVGITGFALKGMLLESFAFGVDYIHSLRGTPAYSMRITDERIGDTFSRIVKDLNWTGGMDLDLLQRKDGTNLLLEINPRLSGTTVFPLRLGINLPMYYVNTLLGIDTRPQFKPSKPGAQRFVSLVEETNYLLTAGKAGQQYALNFRADNKWIDNSFWDDWRYSAALYDFTRRWLLQRVT